MSADNKPSIVFDKQHEQVPFDTLIEALTEMGLETRLDPEISSFASFEITRENNEIRKITIEVPRPNGRVVHCSLSRYYGSGVGEPVAVYLGLVSEYNPEELKKKHSFKQVEGVSVYGVYPLPIETIQSDLDRTGQKNAIYFVCKSLPNQTSRVLNINQDGIINLQ